MRTLEDGASERSSVWLRGVCGVVAATLLSAIYPATYLEFWAWQWRTHGSTGQPITGVVSALSLFALFTSPGLIAVITVGTHRRPAGCRARWGLLMGLPAGLAWTWALYSWEVSVALQHHLSVVWSVVTGGFVRVLYMFAGVMLVSWIAAIIWRRRQRSLPPTEAAPSP